MPPIATFLTGTKIAIETDRSTAPSAGQLNGGGGGSGLAPWWGSGRWFDVITDGLPQTQDMQAIIFPEGHAGQRTVNNQPPVAGRKWSEGEFEAPVVADFLGVLLYAALGGISSNMVPGETSILDAEPGGANDLKLLVLAKQPNSGGNVFRIEVKGTLPSNAGLVSISGIDAYGNGASETITIPREGLYWSRTSWSSVGASSLAVCRLTATSITITGVKNYTHTFFTASCAPTIAMEKLGVPVAGNPASKSHIVPGLVVREVGLTTEANDPEGIFRLSADFEGDPTATSNSTSINAASPLKIWPAWTLKVQRDGGTAWNVVTSMETTIEAGNRNYMTAAGSQSPQGKFAGPVAITGNMTILVDNEFEYDKWRGASSISLHARWYTDWKLTSTQNYELSASFLTYLETVEVDEEDDAYILNADYRTVNDSNFGIGRFTLTNGTPGRAYGNSVV